MHDHCTISYNILTMLLTVWTELSHTWTETRTDGRSTMCSYAVCCQCGNGQSYTAWLHVCLRQTFWPQLVTLITRSSADAEGPHNVPQMW